MGTGSKYVSGRDVKDIAKLVRADLAAAIKAGTLPAIRTTVRIDRYSMGCSLDVRITSGPLGILNPAYVRARAADPHAWTDRDVPRYSDEGQALLAAVEAIVLAYQRNDSDLQSDYYDVNFSASVDFDRLFESVAQDYALERSDDSAAA